MHSAPVTAAGTHALRQRAAVARLLLNGAPEAAHALDWDTLDRAPAWLALPPDDLANLQCRLGAVQSAAAIRLWIDSARLSAASAVLGEPFLQAVLGLADDATAPTPPCIETAAQVQPVLCQVGAAVLLGSLPPGRLRRAVQAALAPDVILALDRDAADATLQRAQSLLVRQPPEAEQDDATRPGRST